MGAQQSECLADGQRDVHFAGSLLAIVAQNEGNFTNDGIELGQMHQQFVRAGEAGAGDQTAVAETLERADKETGLVTMCCGGGLGTGTLLRRG